MAQLRKRGPYWELCWYGPEIDPRTGKKARHRESLGRWDRISKRDADLAVKAKERELFLGKHQLLAPASPPISAWASQYLNWHSLQFPDSHYRTRQILEQHILPGWKWKRLDEISDRDIEDKLCAWRNAGYRANTLVKHLTALRAFFNRAVDKGLLEKNPARAVVDPKVLDSKPHEYYTAEELQRLYLESGRDTAHPNRPQFEPWHAPAWKFMVNTGIRRGEALRLRRRWIGREALKIVSTGEDRTKDGEWREIPLFPGAAEALEMLPADGDLVFPQIEPPSLSRAAKRCLVRACLPGSLHTFRHTFICHLAMDPAVPIRDIQNWAGHASLETTEKYLYLRRKAPPVNLHL